MRTGSRKLLALLAAVLMLAAACGGGRDTGVGAEDGGDAGGDDAATSGSESASAGEGVVGIGPVECPDDPTSVPGVSEDSVLLGGIYPLSGPASAYAAIGEGAQAHFAYVNNENDGLQGPWEGRQIELDVLDDGYNPPRTVEAAREHIQQNNVFALFNTLGTPPNSAIWDYVNEQGVPHVFVATGASKWGRNPTEHPWTIGWQPNYVAEARVYADYLAEDNPEATIAILYQNDDYGKDLLNGFTNALENLEVENNLEIVAQESYETTDPTVESQVANLAQSGADVFLNITTPTFAAQALAADAQNQQWNPLHIVNNVSASATVLNQVNTEAMDRIISTQYYKDPADDQWQDDEAVQLYREKLAEYASGADPTNAFHMFGWTVADSMVHSMENMQCISRSALMEAVRNLEEVEIGGLLPGVLLETDGADDGFPIETWQLMEWQDGEWNLFGDPVDTREEFGPLPEEE